MFASATISKLILYLVKHKRTEHACEQADWDRVTFNYEGSEVVVSNVPLYFLLPT